MLIDAASMPMDEVLVIIQLSDKLPPFKCQYCRQVHADQPSWLWCNTKAIELHDKNLPFNAAFPCAAELYPGRFDEDSTIVPLPAVTVHTPRIIPYKLAFYEQQQVSLLLKQYAELYFSLPSPPEVTLYTKRVPLPILLTPRQYRDLIAQLMDSACYRNYIDQLRAFVRRTVEFVTEHVTLFIPSVSRPAEVYLVGNTTLYTPYERDVVVVFPDDETSVSINAMLSQTDLSLGELQDILSNLYHLGRLNGRIDGALMFHSGQAANWSATECVYATSTLPLVNQFSFSFPATPPHDEISARGPALADRKPDATDAVTARLLELCRELYELARPATEALINAYLADLKEASTWTR